MAQGLAPLGGVAAVALLAAAGLTEGFRARQPLPTADINHSKHVVENEIPCEQCHRGLAEEDEDGNEITPSAHAGVPSIAICTECHEEDDEEALGGTPNAHRIAEHIAKQEELWWPTLYEVPSHVLFSHRRHVAIGGLECRECHGDIGETTTLPTEPVGETLTMDGCLDCHARKGASEDCFACHK